ncbi:MAG: phosphate acyltransferase [Halarsenatibacteraceae bacterium]
MIAEDIKFPPANFEELYDTAVAISSKLAAQKLIVTGPENKTILEAIDKAYQDGLVTPYLVGNQEEILKIAGELGLNIEGYKIIDAAENREKALKSIECLVNEGDILMKGLIPTSIILGVLLEKGKPLLKREVLSHLILADIPILDRLIFISDGGMNISPDYKTKKAIINNAVEVAKEFGWIKPKVALLAAVEKVNQDMPETVVIARIVAEFDECMLGAYLDGPLALDLAISQKAAEIKDFDSPVAGAADILITPEIISGNLLGKSSIYFGGGKIAALLGGVAKPVSIPSRAADKETRLASIAAAIIQGSRYNE